MSKPVVIVGEDADTTEIARMLAVYRIKRVPVVRGEQVVGIVSRENLLRWLANEERHQSVKPKEGSVARALEDALAPLKWHFERPHHETQLQATPMTQPDEPALGAADFRRLVLDFENKEARRHQDLLRSVEEQKHRAGLIGKHISEDAWRNLIHGARTAAEQGQKEYQLLPFPSQLCSNGGRAINVPDPDWPATLRGEAAEVSSMEPRSEARMVSILRRGFWTFPVECRASRP